MDQPPPLISKISFSISFTVVLLVFIEIISAISVKVTEIRQGGLENAQAAAKLSVYKFEPWAPTYWREEVAAFRVVYEPYILWKRAPYHGETVNIDDDGLRLTAHSRCDGQNYTIWTFGGSTMWGAGAPDWLTIPSLLAEQYEKAGKPVCIRNFGTTAWVNTQETIALFEELKRASRKPDLVIFYDGVNDSYTLYQSGSIDVPNNNNLIREKFEAGSPIQTGWTRPRANTLLEFLRESKTATAISRLAARLRRSRNPSQPAFTRQLTDEQLRLQFNQAYLKNLDLVSEMGKQDGFKYAFFWQPDLLVGHKQLSDEEEAILKRMVSSNGGIQETFQKMYSLAQVQNREDFFDIADVLDSHSGTIYIDFAHLCPQGNQIVADRMYDVLRLHGM